LPIAVPLQQAIVGRSVARIAIIGNSGSGKSTLATRLATASALAHLDLDTLAWLRTEPPARRSLTDSAHDVAGFVAAHPRWVIEGCYADLVELVLPACSCLALLDPGTDACVANARSRPWEPHKYATPSAQDANLAMLVGWIRDYELRDDGVFSRRAHEALFERFTGAKQRLQSRAAIAAFVDSL
jgi:adenylate kinase family enzyme